ncbi:MAG: hypothetical protein K8T89_25530, partial [Planctomycetes bacterium]|nr:hypothetical protein [Planctomycetota bacterium]
MSLVLWKLFGNGRRYGLRVIFFFGHRRRQRCWLFFLLLDEVDVNEIAEDAQEHAKDDRPYPDVTFQLAVRAQFFALAAFFLLFLGSIVVFVIIVLNLAIF